MLRSVLKKETEEGGSQQDQSHVWPTCVTSLRFLFKFFFFFNLISLNIDFFPFSVEYLVHLKSGPLEKSLTLDEVHFSS